MSQNNGNTDKKLTVSNTQEATSSSKGVFWIMGGVLTAIFLCLSFVTKWELACVGPMFLVYIIFIISLAEVNAKEKAEQEKAALEKRALSKLKNNYKEIAANINIPETAKTITYLSHNPDSSIGLANAKQRVYIWKSDGDICFFPCSPDSVDSISIKSLAINSIPVNTIEYFSTRGEVFRENKISGGGGGGSSLGGAVVGGMIAGETGAVIGSRQKVKDVKSELITHDTRETFLNYFVGSERHTLSFGISDHQTFNDLIPEKEFSIVNAVKSSELIKSQIGSGEQKNVPDQIRELAKLRDEGIITEFEFSEKKKQLLDKIN